MFLGVYWNQLACLSIHVSVCLSLYKKTSSCESAGGVIKSHLVTALVANNFPYKHNFYLVAKNFPYKLNFYLVAKNFP